MGHLLRYLPTLHCLFHPPDQPLPNRIASQEFATKQCKTKTHRIASRLDSIYSSPLSLDLKTCPCPSFTMALNSKAANGKIINSSPLNQQDLRETDKVGMRPGSPNHCSKEDKLTASFDIAHPPYLEMDPNVHELTALGQAPGTQAQVNLAQVTQTQVIPAKVTQAGGAQGNLVEESVGCSLAMPVGNPIGIGFNVKSKGTCRHKVACICPLVTAAIIIIAGNLAWVVLRYGRP